MTTEWALNNFTRRQVVGNKPKKPKPPCPWHPTEIEFLAGGKCRLCGYPVTRHMKEVQDGRF